MSIKLNHKMAEEIDIYLFGTYLAKCAYNDFIYLT